MVEKKICRQARNLQSMKQWLSLVSNYEKAEAVQKHDERFTNNLFSGGLFISRSLDG